MAWSEEAITITLYGDIFEHFQTLDISDTLGNILLRNTQNKWR